MLSNKKIAVIGAGHMGAALIGGMLRAKLTAPKNITASRRNEEALAALKKDWGININTDNKKAAAGADIVLLDNMNPVQLRLAVQKVKGRAKTEASGGVNLGNIQTIAKTGVDFIPIGAMTHSARAADMGLDFEN